LSNTHNHIHTRQENIIEDYHGTPVADPYRWLEDPASAETLGWVEAQNAVTADYLAKVPARESIKARLTGLWDYPRYSVPQKRGNRYFFTKNSGLQNQAIFYMQETPASEPIAILDPNTLSDDGTIALTNVSPSEDGKLLAYSLSSSGSDRQEIRIRDVDNGNDYAEVIKWCKFSNIAWRHDNAGFFYNRFPEPGTVAQEDENTFSRVYWHQVGTPQAEDQLIYERPDFKELTFYPTITDDGAYLILFVTHGSASENRIYYRQVESDGPFIRLLDDADAIYSPIGNSGPIFYFHTTQAAPRGRIIAIDTRNPERTQWQELIPQQDDIIAFASVVNDQFVVTYMHDAHHRVRLYNFDGSFTREIALPALGSIFELSGRSRDTELFINFTSFLYPPSIFRYDFASGALTLLWDVGLNFDPAGYETTQVFYPSKDGTRVPMFLTHKKGLALDGNNPTLLFGYGGFNISLTPVFAVGPLLWIEHGGVFARANLRGGGEYGEEWHHAGMLEKKQNVFDDFIAAAEWLIANKYTRTSRLAINGGSNGGLLVAASMLQRPDLYGAVVCAVPVIDMLRYHKFTVGRYWIPEYGNAEADPEHFKFLYAYSPLHNVKEGVAYPPTLILSADTDDRVVPAHAKKFGATLQAASSNDHPILLRIETKAGHGFGKPTTKIIEEQADMYAFLFDIFCVDD
jgi:prolyl oligopeptidase